MRFSHLSLVMLVIMLLAACTSSTITLPDSVPTAIPPELHPTQLATIALRPPETAMPSPTATFVIPYLTPYPDDTTFSIGKSIEGRDIWLWQLGDGSRSIVLIGGLHGGYEGNTVVLVEQLVDHFRSNPDKVLPTIELVLIPNANPDGLARGSALEGRFNANGVDLNRNWGCEWEPTAYLRDVEVSPGPRPFSEPESLALRAYFVSEDPAAVIFYHSSAGGIFMGACGKNEGAKWMGDLLEDATGYPHYDSFDYYDVTGDATNWLDERSVPAAVIELFTDDEPEFEENLAGVMALQCYFVQQVQPSPDDLTEQQARAIERYCTEE